MGGKLGSSGAEVEGNRGGGPGGLGLENLTGIGGGRVSRRGGASPGAWETSVGPTVDADDGLIGQRWLTADTPLRIHSLILEFSSSAAAGQNGMEKRSIFTNHKYLHMVGAYNLFV